MTTADLDSAAIGSAHGSPSAGSRRVGGVRRWWLAHRRSASVLGPLLILAGVAQAVNMWRFPAHIDDEGTYVAQAYAVQHYGSLSHYTYWYDHPPLGWLQMALYNWVTDAFGRYSNAIDAGREFMLVVQVISCGLLWIVCRRLLLSRWAAALAVALFAFSPLAIQYHRTVYLDNIATPWLIASFALALTPQKRLSAFVGSALCLSVAVLSKETSLLVLPAVAVLLWRGTRDSGSRRYALTLSAVAFVLGTGTYLLYAAIKGELVPGPGHVSLWGGVKFQLFTRTASGTILQPGSLSYAHLHEWLQLDPVLPAAAATATVIGLFMRKIRPVAIGLALLLLIMLKPGYLPVPYVIAMLPLAAVVVAGVVDVTAHWRPPRWKIAAPAPWHRAAPSAVLAVVAAAAFAAAAVPQWGRTYRALYNTDPNAPIAASEAWIEHNVPTSDRMAVDDAYWLDLVRHGYPRDNVVWYYKIDTDPAVERLSPDGWRDYDYLILTPSVRSDPQGLASVRDAIDNSAVVAEFGTGDQQVIIRRVIPTGASRLPAAITADAADRKLAEAALLSNHAITATAPARGVLARGTLDLRAATTLAALSTLQPLQLTKVGVVTAEAAAGQPARSVTIHGPSAATVNRVIASLPAAYGGATVTATPDGGLDLRWPVDPVPPDFSF